MSGRRSERVGDQLRRLLARLLQDVRDPRLGFVTLTDVKLSPDLRHARVFVTFHEEAEAREAGLAALNRAAPFLRRSLAREAGLRLTPDLRFCHDDALDRGLRVESLLRQVLPDPEAVSGAPPEDRKPE